MTQIEDSTIVPATMEEPTHEAALAGLFTEQGRQALDEKHRLLASADPALWEQVTFPIELALELSSACNLRCVMCPVPTTSRPPSLMEDEVFRRAVDAVAAGDHQGFVLLPQGFGESFLHPRWADLLAHARERGIRPIVLLTNGMLLTEKNIELILNLGIEALVVSIDGVDHKTYAALRVRGDLATVEHNVHRFLAMRGGSAQPKLVLRIIRMQDTEAEIDAFFTRWRPFLSEYDEIQINEFNDWAGKVDDRSINGGSTASLRRGPCRMLWKNLSVHADGKVSACCHDSEDELIVGDLGAGETLDEVWGGGKLARLRRLHVAGRLEELPICKSCKNWI